MRKLILHILETNLLWTGRKVKVQKILNSQLFILEVYNQIYRKLRKNVSIICMVSLQVQELHFLHQKNTRHSRENNTKFKGETCEQKINIKMPRTLC